MFPWAVIQVSKLGHDDSSNWELAFHGQECALANFHRGPVQGDLEDWLGDVGGGEDSLRGGGELAYKRRKVKRLVVAERTAS